MKQVKFTKYEKIAGIFVVGSLTCLLGIFAIVAIQQGWLESKVSLQTELAEADGLRRGTSVQMAGLKVGSVTDVFLNSKDSVLVKFKVQQTFFDKIRSDSVVTVARPFIIGEKVLDITVGSESAEGVAENASLPSEPSFDMLDLLNGRKIGSLFQNMSSALENLRHLVDAFSDQKRTKDFVEIYDEMKPLVFNLSRMAQETHWLVLHMNKKDRMVKLVDELQKTSRDVNSLMPGVLEHAPDLIENLNHLTENLNSVTKDLAEFLPLMKEFGPEMPRVGRRAIEALDETVITLKAMQQSFLLRGAAKNVRSKEAERETPEEEQRLPAGLEQP